MMIHCSVDRGLREALSGKTASQGILRTGILAKGAVKR
jgi:hypothetical protein